jgi:hypothetical protein
MIMRPLAAAVLFLLPVLVALAQPNPFGCHFFRHQPHFTGYTEQDRTDIQSTIARSDTFDIIHYDIHLDVTNVSGQYIKGVTTVTFRALMPDQQDIRFDLLSLQVDSVTGDGGAYTHVNDGTYLRVFLPYVPEVGVDHELTVHYQGQPHKDPYWGGFYFEQGYIYNLGIGLTSIPPNFGKVWYPCFDSFVERATYSYHVKSTGNYRFHGQGDLVEEVMLEGDTVIRSYAFNYAIPTHLSAIAVSNYNTHEFMHPAMNGPIPVTLKAKPSNLNVMVTKFENLGAAIDACEHWYGPYPFNRVGYIHTIDGALEIPTNIAYPQHMNGQTDYLNRGLFTHELGHMWWGDIVTPHVHNDMWLKEGPAEYSGHLLEEWLSGQEGFEFALKENLIYVMRRAHVNDDGFQALSPMPDEHIYGTHTYYKGALVMHNLRGYMGDEAFRTALQGVQDDHGYSTITPEQFKATLEAYGNMDLTAFFDAWVFGRTYSVFEVLDWSAEQAGEAWTVQMQVGQKVRGGEQLHHSVPLDVTFINANGEAHEAQVMVGGPANEFTLSSPFQPAMVVLNRHQRLNLARLDQEVIMSTGPNDNRQLNFAEARIISQNAAEESFVRVEHLWVAPDQAVAADVLDISGTHYWNIDGLWQDGAPLKARFTYTGDIPTALDHELIGGDEYGLCILYRAHSSDEWQVYPDQLAFPGSDLTNGTGSLEATVLRRGQYAFGRTTGFVNIDDSQKIPTYDMKVHPVPARDRLTVAGHIPAHHTLIIDVLSLDGRIAGRSVAQAEGDFNEVLDVTPLGAGAYVLRVMTTDGLLVGSSRFEVVR